MVHLGQLCYYSEYKVWKFRWMYMCSTDKTKGHIWLYIHLHCQLQLFKENIVFENFIFLKQAIYVNRYVCTFHIILGGKLLSEVLNFICEWQIAGANDDASSNGWNAIEMLEMHKNAISCRILGTIICLVDNSFLKCVLIPRILADVWFLITKF